MYDDLDYKQAYEKKKLELEFILKLTQAISNNVNEEVLFKVYNYILIAQSQVSRHLLILNNAEAEIKSIIGIDNEIEFQNEFLKNGKDSELFKSTFDDYFEVIYEEKILAHVFFKFENVLSKKEQLSFIQTISNIVMVAIENKKLTIQNMEQEAFQKELDIARNVQNILFPKELPSNQNLEMYASYIPHSTVSGDYYDYIKKSDTEYVICIADVSGKGVPAAILMSNFQATLRTLVRQNLMLREIINELNHIAYSNTGGERFITAFICLLDLKKRVLYYVNAGHNHPFYVDKNRNIKKLDIGTTLLGAMEELPSVEIGKIELIDYSLLFCFTDGLVEVFDENGVQFNEDSLVDFLKSEKTSSLADFHEELLQIVKKYADNGTYNDDITMLSCKFRF